MGQYLNKLEQDTAHRIQHAESDLAALTKRQEWQVVRTTADIAGIFDPSPTADTVSLLMSTAEGDWVGALLSGVSYIPYLGDALAKPVKLRRATKAVTTIEREATALAAKIAHHKSFANRIALRKEAAAQERARRAKNAAERYAEAMKCASCPKPSRFGTHLPTTGSWKGEKGNSRWVSSDGSVSVEYKAGYPDFSTSHPASLYPRGGGAVEIEMKGDASDFATARDAMRAKLGDSKWPGGRGNAPDGYTWHHAEDGVSMQLIRKEVHDKAESGVAHVGGESIVSGKDNLKQDSQF